MQGQQTTLLHRLRWTGHPAQEDLATGQIGGKKLKIKNKNKIKIKPCYLLAT
jgi:hypothetical protein